MAMDSLPTGLRLMKDLSRSTLSADLNAVAIVWRLLMGERTLRGFCDAGEKDDESATVEP